MGDGGDRGHQPQDPCGRRAGRRCPVSHSGPRRRGIGGATPPWCRRVRPSGSGRRPRRRASTTVGRRPRNPGGHLRGGRQLMRPGPVLAGANGAAGTRLAHIRYVAGLRHRFGTRGRQSVAETRGYWLDAQVEVSVNHLIVGELEDRADLLGDLAGGRLQWRVGQSASCGRLTPSGGMSQVVKGGVVVLDNLAAHKIAGLCEAFRAIGASLLHLPPYSPDLNPIE
ncbi:hypothetical protein EAH89_18965 [Roseomonas nepalensis]|uniref:Tc1-like transposase DDE domain-containing protein n=1 Tax=Muricoccus nepalensis TaxID=1854500 RepID=A0A502FT72_9PROT|nr:hypothetical protein EAH89_18965 [Roseomonas nepalensis]